MKQIFLGVALLISTLTLNAKSLDFDVLSLNHSWTEDGLDWSYYGMGTDNIGNTNPYRGMGHGQSFAGNDSRLGTSMNFDMQGLYLYTEFGMSFTHLVIKGYDKDGNEIKSKVLEPLDYNKAYKFVNLQWKNIASFEVEFDISNELETPIVHYDNVMYTPERTVDAVAFASPTIEEVGEQPAELGVSNNTVSKEGSMEMILFPNPAFGNESTVAIKNMPKGNKVVEIRILDGNGTMVSEEKIRTHEVNYKHRMSGLESLVPGPHVIQLNIGGKIFTETLMVR